MFERRRSFAATALLLAYAGCDNPNEPAPAGPAAVLEIVSGDAQETAVGELLPQPLVVRVTDANGRPVADHLLNFRVVAGDGSVTAGALLTDDDGLAQERWTLGGTAADTQRVEVRVVDRATSQALIVAKFTAVGRPGPAVAIAPLAAVDHSGPAGLPLADSVAVRVADRFGNGVPNVAVVWRVVSGGGGISLPTAATDARGVARALWTLGPRMDSTQTVSAAAGLLLVTQIRARASLPPSVVLTRLSGDAQHGIVGAELAEPLVVLLTLPDGRPLPGATIRWTVNTGGSISTGTADAAGRIAARWTLGTAAGQQAVAAGIDGALPVSFAATAEAGQPDALAITAGNAQSAIVGTTLPQQLSARITDRYGNAVPGILVHWAVGSQGGSARPDASLSDSAGIARTTWTLGDAAGNATLTASAAAAPPAAFTARAEPRGTKLVFLEPFPTASAGEAINPTVRVAILNEFGSRDPTATAAVTLAVVGDTTRAIVSGATASAVAGVATFPDFQIDRPGSFDLAASAYGVTDTRANLRIGLTIADFSHGSTHTCAVAANDLAYCWGDNLGGRLGDGTTIDRSTPTPVVGGLRFRTVSASRTQAGHHTCGVTLSGDAYCWGPHIFGGSRPVLVPGGLRFVQVSAGSSHTCAVTDTNDAYCWGENADGQLGMGSVSSARGVTPVAGNLKFAEVSAGTRFTCGVTTDDRVYCWGTNSTFQLGIGTQETRVSPTPLQSSLAFVQVSAGERSACGITTDHAAYCWGGNLIGQLGDGSLAPRRTPHPVAGGLLFTTVSTATQHTCGVTTDGAAYCWGSNSGGRLGDGTTADRLEPVLVRGGLSFARVHAGSGTCGVTTTGLAYCWGSNRLVPTPVAH